MTSFQLFPDLLRHDQDHELQPPSKRRRLFDLPPPSSRSPRPPLDLSLSLSLPHPAFPPAQPLVARKLRMLFEKKLSDSDVSRGQDRLLLGKRSHGCLGTHNSPSAPDWRDVALVFHDEKEPGKTWQLIHGLWPSTKAFVLKGRDWSKFREYKRLQAKDILTISVDDADGSLWISHCATETPPPPRALVHQPPQQQQQQQDLLHSSRSSPWPETLVLFPSSPDLQSRFTPLTPSAAPPIIPLQKSLAFLDLKLGLPTPSDSTTPPSPPTAPSRSCTSISTTSERSSTCTLNNRRSTSEDRSSGEYSSPPAASQVDQGSTNSKLLTLARRLLRDYLDRNAARVEGPKGPNGWNLRVLFVKLLTDEDVSPGQDTLLLQGKWSRGCLGRANTPSPPEWPDVSLIVHDMDEMGRTWQFFHCFQQLSKAYVLKGEQLNQFRAHKRLQAKDFLVISANDADGSLWISHRRRSRRKEDDM